MPRGHEANRPLAVKRSVDKRKLHRIVRNGPPGGMTIRGIAEEAGLPKSRVSSILIEMVAVDKLITKYMRKVGKQKKWFFRLRAGDRQELQLFD